MSRFFKNVNDSSDSSDASDISDSEYESSISQSDNESSYSQAANEQAEAAKPKSRFLRTEDDLESDDEGKRVVRSLKEKKIEEVESVVRSMENAKKINDWCCVEREFDLLLKILVKNASVVGVPKIFLKALDEMQFEGDKKKMNALNTKSFNAMKQKVRKMEKVYSAELEKYRLKCDEVEGTPVKEPNNQKDTVKVGGTQENVLKRLNEIMSVRGKKNTDKIDQIDNLRELMKLTKNCSQKAKVLMALISSQFDKMTSIMDFQTWKIVELDVMELIRILETNNQILVPEDEEVERNDLDNCSMVDVTINVRASVVSFVTRLDDEFVKALLNIDPHSTDYVERLKEENSLFKLIIRAERYFRSCNDYDSLCVILEKKLDRLYYKKVDECKQIDRGDQGETNVSAICSFLYKYGNDRTRIKSLLFHIYNHSIYGRFFEARDLLLMSHIQETIGSADIPIQILYNRTIVQLGFCAFQMGLLKEAHSCLLEIVTSGHYKELLAQGSKEDKLDKTRFIPYHLHINLELVESVFLICSMILEIPNIIYNYVELKKKFVSKSLKRLLVNYERSLFNGVFENSREKIIASSRLMIMGSYEKSIKMVLEMKIWDLLNGKAIRSMLTRKMLEECCKTFFYSTQKIYSSISISFLQSMFQFDQVKLEREAILKIASKLIYNDEIHAQIDVENDLIYFNVNGTSRMQMLTGMVVDKIAFMSEKKK